MTVFLQLETELLTDYCRYLFPPATPDGPCKVSESHSFGKLLISHCRISERPVARPAGDFVLEFELPMSNTTQTLNNKFLYFSKGDADRLNAGLKALFDIDFYSYYQKAEGCGMQKKEIIDAFVTSRKLFNSDPDEALHKRIYRQEATKRKRTMKLLLRRIYYLNETLDDTGITDKK